MTAPLRLPRPDVHVVSLAHSFWRDLTPGVWGWNSPDIPTPSKTYVKQVFDYGFGS